MSQIKETLENAEAVQINGKTHYWVDIESFVNAFLLIAAGREVDPRLVAYIYRHYLKGKHHKKNRIGKKVTKQAIAAMFYVLDHSEESKDQGGEMK